MSGTVGSGSESESEVVGKKENLGVEGMARREESELGVLLKYMMEKEERNRAEDRERRREEEERRREYERIRTEEAERQRPSRVNVEGLRRSSVEKLKGVEIGNLENGGSKKKSEGERRALGGTEESYYRRSLSLWVHTRRVQSWLII